MDWEQAEEHIKYIRSAYTDIGISGMPALQITINPLWVRFEKGERSQELYDDIMSLE
jgi:hypothetical protein